MNMANIAASNPIKITHIASGDLWAGAEVQLYTLAKSCSRLAHVDIHVILFNHGTLETKLREANIDVIVLDESALGGLQILKRLINTIKQQKPDVIHTHRLKENIFGSIAAKLNGSIPCVRTAHGASEHKPTLLQLPKRLIHSIDWLCGRFLQQKIIAVSDDLARKLQHSFPQNRLITIQNGIDLDADSLQIHNEKTTNQPQTINIGIIGRLVEVKRIDLFLETAAFLQQQKQDMPFQFFIYGNGPLEQDLQTLSTSLNLDHCVHFKGHSNQLHNEMQTLDYLLMPSDHEGLPMTLLEAMALKLPIIAHAVGGIPHLLGDGRCGTLVESHTAKAYAAALLTAITDKAKTQVLTTAACQRVHEHYSANKNADQIIDCYQSIR